MVLQASPTPKLMFSEIAGAARSIDTVIGTPLPLIVCKCCCTLILRYGPFALSINLFYEVSSVVVELFMFAVSVGPLKNTRALVLKTGGLRRLFS